MVIRALLIERIQDSGVRIQNGFEYGTGMNTGV
jgi:hypothetical protein